MAIRRIPTKPYRPRQHIRLPGALRRFRHRIPVTLAIIGGVFFLSSAATILWWSRDLPDPQKISSRQVVESTKIFDRTGTHLLYEIGDIRRTAVSFDQISSHLINATLAAEDDQFYQHHGLDFFGIMRGVILKPLSGQRAQGGSTITQQLIKNSILTPERTIRRKVKEAVLAIELEQRFSKDQILEMYLNEIPYGSQSHGVEAASQTHYGLPAKELTIAQAAILASLPKAPTYYSPYGSHFEDLKARQTSIIDRMVSLNMISAEAGEAAKHETLDFKPRAESISAPHFVFYIKEQLDREYGERVVEQGGLKVITTLDMRLQKIAEETLRENQDRLKGLNASNAALVAVDPATGDILTMAGAIDYFNEEIDGNVNIAIRHRSPGSSIKPFIYAAAWQKGYTPETILIDAETDFGQDYRPKNYNLSQSGPVTMRHALANSLNIPAVKALYLAGVKNSAELAQSMGMDSLSDPDRYGLSLVLGGGEVRLLDEVSAYGVFANEGLRQPHRALLKVADGKEIFFDAAEEEQKGDQVISSQLARTVTNVLADNQARAATFGTGSYLQLGNRPVAAKTGTTQDYRDGWTMGYTPSLAAGVWVGNNDNTPMGKGADGSYSAAPIWNTYMREALSGIPVEQFTAPEPTPRPPHAILRGELPEIKGKWEPAANILYPLDCPIETGQNTTFKEIHNILFYVRRDNPQGPPPAHAEADPQYDRWRDGVNVWIEKTNQKNRDRPEEPQYVNSLPIPECNLENQEDVPKVKIEEPGQNTASKSPIRIKVSVDSPQPIKEVRFLFDGQEVAKFGKQDSYEHNLTFPADFSGRKTFLAMAITDQNLVGRGSRTFILNPDDSEPVVTLHTPLNNSRLKPSDFPITAKITAKDPSGIELVDILFTKEGDSGTGRIGRTSEEKPVAPGRYEAIWQDSPGPGKYIVWAVAHDKTGNPGESSRHTIEIE